MSWNPNWVVRPGATLKEEIDERGLSVRMTASLCGLEPSVVQGVIDGEPITLTIAKGLAHLGMSARFWQNLERNYREGLAAGKKEL